MFDANQIDWFFGKLVGSDVKGVAVLKSGFEKFSNSAKFEFDFRFGTDVSGGKLTTKSKCPVFSYYNRWCESGCIEFTRGFASAFGDVKMRKVAKQPESGLLYL